MRKPAPKTRDRYIRAVRHYTRFLARSPDTAVAEDLPRYQLHCVDQGMSAMPYPNCWYLYKPLQA
jgi:hypothetical protein